MEYGLSNIKEFSEASLISKGCDDEDGIVFVDEGIEMFSS